MRVGDLIALPPIETVVQLRDARNPEKRELLVRHFVLTDEVRFGLRVILGRLLDGKGCGVFLKGHFGSGKSHFLAYLALIMSDRKLFKPFAKQFGTGVGPEELVIERLRGLRPAVLSISLVEYRSALNLEDIVFENLQALAPGLGEVPTAAAGAASSDRSSERPGFANRKTFLDRVVAELRDQGYDGLLIVIDELSEFLRSKPSLGRFNEDVRYLQFLGEASESLPVWIVAAVQEYLEEVGEIHQELFNKIKDRYPVRILLTAAHVKSLVRDFLIEKKPGAHKHLRGLFSEIRKAFPDWAAGEEECVALYPVHPASIELLEDLKPLFSKTRGFVDFIHYQIKGDPRRGIAGLLDRPHDTLLCPDRIFDHFLDRMKSTLEIVPYIDTVYAFYRKELPAFLDDSQDREFALRLLKILILQEISPVRHSFTVKELTEMLLERVTDLDPKMNYRYTADIARRLALKGGYLVPVDPDRPPVEQCYRIQLEASVHSIVERKLEYVRRLLGGLGDQVQNRLFLCLVARLPFFEGYRPGARELMVLDWQNTRRRGEVCFAVGGSDALSGEPAEDPEFTLIVGPDGAPPGGLTGSSSFEGPRGLLIPSRIPERDRCVEALALFDLRNEYVADESAQGRRIREYLEARIEDAVALTGPLFERAFSTATLTAPDGTILQELDHPREAGCRHLLEAAAARLLEQRYPKHYRVAPRQSYYPRSALEELVEFFRSMSKESFDRLRWGRTVLEGFLLPTGILTRKRQEYRFCSGGGECGLLELLLDRVNRLEACSARQAQRFLADSEYGVSAAQFEPLLLAALFGGFVQGLRGGRRIALSSFDAKNLMEIEALKPGESVSSRASLFLSRLELLPEKLRKSSLSYTEAQQSWEHLREAKSETASRLEHLERLLLRFREYRAYALTDRGSLQAVLETARAFTKAVLVSRGPVEGIEDFVKEFADAGDLAAGLGAFRNACGFFEHRFAAFSFMTGYLEQVQETVSGDRSRYAEAEEARDRLWSKLERWDPGRLPEAFEELQREFDSLIQLYVPVYLEEHDGYYRSPEYDELERLLKSRELDLLRRLEMLESFLPERSPGALREDICVRLAGRCGRRVWEELQQRPICACGFRPGQERSGDLAEFYQRETEHLLQQFLNQSQHPRFRELLDRFEFHLEKSGEERLLTAVRGLKGLRGVEDLLEMEALFDSGLIRRLNGFEPGKTPFRRKDLRSFKQGLGSRPKPARALVRDFEAWLNDGLSDPEEPILLVDRPVGESSSAGGGLEPVVRRLRPELLPDLRRFSAEEFLFRVFSSDLIRRFRLDRAAAEKWLPLVPEEAALDAYAELAGEILERAAPETEEALRAFDGRLTERVLEALGILGDSLEGAVRTLAREGVYESIVRGAALRAVGRLIRGRGADATRVMRIVEKEWPSSGQSRIEKEHCRWLVESTAWLRRAVERLDCCSETASVPSFRELEALYLEVAAKLPYMLDCGRVHLKQLGLEGAVDWSALASPSADLLDRFSRAFSESIAREESLPRVDTVLREELSKLGGSGAGDGVRLLFVDCVSWGLWIQMREELERSLPPEVRMLKVAAAYAHPPTNTGEQLRRWAEAGGPRPVERVQKGFPPREKKEDRIFGNGRAEEADRRFGFERELRLDWVDEKIHTSRESLFFLHREILQQLVPQVISLLGRGARGGLTVLISDHGFVEDPAFDAGDKYRRSRYRHGGGSPFERIVPVVVFRHERREG